MVLQEDQSLYDYLMGATDTLKLKEHLGFTICPEKNQCEELEKKSRENNLPIYFSLSITSEVEDSGYFDCLIHTWPLQTLEEMIAWLEKIKQVKLPTRVHLFMNGFNLNEEGDGINCQVHMAELEPNDRRIRLPGGDWISEKAYLLKNHLL